MKHTADVTLYTNKNTLLSKIYLEKRVAKINAKRVAFSALRCFKFDGNPQETQCLQILANYLMNKEGLAVCNPDQPLWKSLLSINPQLANKIVAIISESEDSPIITEAFPKATIISMKNLPQTVKTIFLCHLEKFIRLQQSQKIPNNIEVIDADILTDLNPNIIPRDAWSPTGKHIYPIAVPEIKFENDLDFILLDCPARNLSMLPNGVAYVHNALKKTKVKYQTFDLDIISYHWFHIKRIYDENGSVTLPSGKTLPIDPWLAENYDLWAADEVIAYFNPILEETVAKLAKARPKILGLSIHQCNTKFSKILVNKFKTLCPETLIVVGGFSCYHPTIGLRAFPECDYMCIAEADLTVGSLLEALARGERPFNQPGILSKFDTPDYKYIPGPMPHNLDLIEFPKYDWMENISIYRNFNNYQLTPLIASRGCMWSRCTFCAERFFWRIRSPQNFIQELEWLVNQGCRLFMFNESDLNGRPEILMQICDEIIRRGIKVKLTGQLRIHKKSDRAFFDKLKAGGFVALRFGVDAFSENTLKLQKKGYTLEMVAQNLKDCWEAGIYTEVNWVVGVPGETWDDVNEGVQFILENQKYIGRLANINPLILVNGSVYWIDPEKHDIVLHGDKKELFAQNPSYIPADKWHSINPYIDAQVRKQYFEHIVVSLYKAGFPLGDWAARVVDDVVSGRDRARATAEKNNSAEQNPLPQENNKKIELKRILKTHTIFQYNDSFYAVPNSWNKTDLSISELEAEGVLKDQTLTNLIFKVEEANKWADTRGLYDAQEVQRAGAAAMRANSLIGDQKIEMQVAKPIIVKFKQQYFLIEEDELKKNNLFNETKLQIKEVVTTGVDPELLFSIGNYNLVEFDGEFFGCLQGKPINFQKLYLFDQTIFRSNDLVGLIETIEKIVGITRPAIDIQNQTSAAYEKISYSAKPTLIKSVDTYNLVSFEGWIYGVPQSLGPIDLTEIDVTNLPGVIRDLSPTVVEQEIKQRRSQNIAA